MRTLIRSVSTASSRLLERPDKILLIPGWKFQYMGEGNGLKFPGQMCQDVYTQQPGRWSEVEHFYKTRDWHHPKARESGALKIRSFVWEELVKPMWS